MPKSPFKDSCRPEQLFTEHLQATASISTALIILKLS